MRHEICCTWRNVINVVCKVSFMFGHWYVGHVVCVVSDIWRVSGMWVSVVGSLVSGARGMCSQLYMEG